MEVRKKKAEEKGECKIMWRTLKVKVSMEELL